MNFFLDGCILTVKSRPWLASVLKDRGKLNALSLCCFRTVRGSVTGSWADFGWFMATVHIESWGDPQDLSMMEKWLFIEGGGLNA